MGSIKYTETVKLDLDLPEGVELGGMIKDGMVTNKDLFFTKKHSVYTDSKENESGEAEMASDDGSIMIKIKRDDSEDIYYTDFANKKVIHQNGFMGKDFLIKSDLTPVKWKISNDRIKYLGYVCQKATMTKVGPEKDEQGELVRQDVVAWFTTEIPVPIGPESYNQLPGAVLMVSVDDGQTEIKAVEIIREEPSEKQLSAPKKGKVVTPEEFEKIVAEKTKEMEKMNGGRRIMIRG